MRLLALAAVLTLCACSSETPEPQLDAGAPLDATLDEPLLLTVAAARAHTQYLLDEGYTLVRDAELTAFTTDTSGTFGVTLFVDGAIASGAPRIAYAASDSLVVRSTPADGLSLEERFVAATSRVAIDELLITNESKRTRTLDVIAWVRRCDRPFASAAAFDRGIGARHEDPPDVLAAAVAGGSYVEHLRDALVIDGTKAVTAASLAACGASVRDDLASLRGSQLSADAAVLGVRTPIEIPAGASRKLRVLRGVANRTEGDTRQADLDAARALDVPALVREGQARLAAMPAREGLTRDQQLLWRSSFTLLDQVMMPAEGKLADPYFLFSREPGWWFSKLGQHIHEGLALIALAKMDPALAKAPLRNFFRRVESDGYLPYNIGPVLEQTAARTASAPLLAYVAWETGRDDAAFLAEAYEPCVRFHRFWLEQRDKDKDGLAEWGGYAVTESLRDLENVIWNNVVAPDQVEAVDLNAMLVVEERTLASMARALGKPAEADDWDAKATRRAELINANLWDETTGFYFHRRYDTHTFSASAPDDLKRLEIAGFTPLWAGIVPADRKARVLGHLLNAQEFWRPGGVPGLAATDAYYDPAASQCCRWRGPVWVPWMYLLERALLAAGEREAARVLVERTERSVMTQLRALHQFRELYDPDDASAPNHSMPNYVWSAMVPLMRLELDAP